MLLPCILVFSRLQVQYCQEVVVGDDAANAGVPSHVCPASILSEGMLADGWHMDRLIPTFPARAGHPQHIDRREERRACADAQLYRPLPTFYSFLQSKACFFQVIIRLAEGARGSG
jgi:hypothetical protein